jgi:hypothetical protein
VEVAEKHHTDSVRPRWLISAIVDPLLLALICICFFWKLVLTNQYTWLESPDLAYQVLPWYQFQAGEWHAGRLPLWDPYLWNGQPLIGQVVSGVAYPLNWILFLLPLRNGWIQLGFLHWYYVAIHWMGSVFCYWLCRDLGRGRAASIFAGSLFALSGYMGSTDWPQMLNGAVWVPLAILFMLRALHGRRMIASSALCGVFWGISWLSGHHQIPIFLSLIILGTFAYTALEMSPTSLLGFRVRWRPIGLACLAVGFAVTAGALQILPGLEYGRLAVRWVNAENPVRWNDIVPYSVHAYYSLNPLSLLGVVIPGLHRHVDAFIGAVALILAGLATSLLWHDRIVRLFFAIALAGVLLALGQWDVLHGILYSLLPFVEKARSPGMAIFLFHFGISVLCAYGIDSFQSPTVSEWARRIRIAAFASGTFLLGLNVVVVAIRPQNFGDERVIIVALCALGMSGVLWAWQTKAMQFPALAACAFGLMVVEIGLVTNAYLPHQSEHNRNTLLPQLREYADVAGYLRDQGFNRVEVDGDAIKFNFGDWYGLETYRGYLASLTANLQDLETEQRWTARLFGVKYAVRKDPQFPDQQRVFSGSSGMNVYLNPDSLPRVWTVHQIVSVAHVGEARKFIREEDFRHKAFVLGKPPAVESCPEGDNVDLLYHAPNRVLIQANMKCRGMVVLSDTSFPGWVAHLDGRPVPIHEAYLALRGVLVDAGNHRIEMVYRPRSVQLGGALSLTSILVAALLAFRRQT